MDTKLKSSRKLNAILTGLVLFICSFGMLLSYSSLARTLDSAGETEEEIPGTIYNMGSGLAEGNYILYNEVYEETPQEEVLEDYGKTSFDLLRKYMEYGVFDANGESLHDSTGTEAADRLQARDSDYYAFRAEYTFSVDGELSDVVVSGERLTADEEYTAEGTYVSQAEEAANEMISDISSPGDVTIIYGMTEDSLLEYCDIDYEGVTVYTLIDSGHFSANVLLFGTFAFFAAWGIPCIRRVGRWEGKFFQMPAEVPILVLLCIALPLDVVAGIVYSTLNGDLYNDWFGGLPTLLLNFAAWIVFFGIIYWAATCLRDMFTMKGAYLRERTLTAKVIRWFKNGGGRYGRKIKGFFSKQYDALLHLDFRDKTNRTILRVVIINFVILFFVCVFWFYGIFALIVYSVLLFFFLRKYVRDLQEKYKELLKSTNQLAEGHLDIPIEGDIGLFNPIQEELKKIQKGFKKAVEEEVKNERMKTELVTNVSHDLRTPLTAIITYTDLLKNENDEQKRKEYIEVLERKSLRLKVLIEDLFEISKAASKSVVMHYMKVDIVDLLKQVGLENDSKIKEANLEFRWKLPDHKIIMWLDSQKTYRIFENLIVNITKYAMPHTRVYIEMTDTGTDAHISMKNVSATELNFDVDEITDRFVRGDSSRNTEGSGLGLAIAKSFVELQHGSLKISTEADLFKADIILPKMEMPEEEKEQLQG